MLNPYGHRRTVDLDVGLFQRSDFYGAKSCENGEPDEVGEIGLNYFQQLGDFILCKLLGCRRLLTGHGKLSHRAIADSKLLAPSEHRFHLTQGVEASIRSPAVMLAGIGVVGVQVSKRDVGYLLVPYVV